MGVVFTRLRDAISKRKQRHDDKREAGAQVQYTLTGFVWAFMIWILEAIPATHRYASKKTKREIILRAFAWSLSQQFSWARCSSLFDGENLASPLETLTPTKSESDTIWWKASLEYFEGISDESEVLVCKQVENEKDNLSEQVLKKRKRCTSEPSVHSPTYDELMTKVG